MGNVVNPDEMIESYGADAFRIYEMFMGPFTQSANFNENGVSGAHTFLRRVWQLQDKIGVDTQDKNLIIYFIKQLKR